MQREISATGVGLPEHAPATTPSSGKPIVLPARLGHVLCLDDFEVAARRHLPRPVFAYVSGGVERNHSLRKNSKAFDAFEFVTRVLVDTSKRSTETQLFDRTWSAPIGIAPMGICALSAYRGDLVLTQAAAHENIPMVVSGSSLIRDGLARGGFGRSM